MKLIQRVGYYLGGFSIGLIILAFFLGKKGASCSYSPNARVLKNISGKRLVYSENASNELILKKIDSSAISHTLSNGDVNFSESNTTLDYCKIYVIEDSLDGKTITLTVENCEQKVIVKSVKIN